MCKSIFKQIFRYDEIDSTQKEIWRRIENNNIENGSAIIAKIQTSGIGTHGRKWYTSNSNNIAISFVVFPNKPVKEFSSLTLEIAEDVVCVFKEKYGILLDIKQPNDIVKNGKKVGGILTETKLQGEIVKAIVVGIGINTNQTIFDKEIENIATSIKNEFNIEVDNELIIEELGYKLAKGCLACTLKEE